MGSNEVSPPRRPGPSEAFESCGREVWESPLPHDCTNVKPAMPIEAELAVARDVARVGLINGVRAVLGRAEVSKSHRATDRLAATLAYYWARDADPQSPMGRFIETGALSERMVDELYEELVALEQAAEPGSAVPRRDAEWTPQAIVRALLEYAAVHRPRGPVPGWKSLPDDGVAAMVFGRPSGG